MSSRSHTSQGSPIDLLSLLRISYRPSPQYLPYRPPTRPQPLPPPPRMISTSSCLAISGTPHTLTTTSNHNMVGLALHGAACSRQHTGAVPWSTPSQRRPQSVARQTRSRSSLMRETVRPRPLGQPHLPSPSWTERGYPHEVKVRKTRALLVLSLLALVSQKLSLLPEHPPRATSRPRQ